MELPEAVVAPLTALAVAVKPSSTVLRAISRPERREPYRGISFQKQQPKLVPLLAFACVCGQNTADGRAAAFGLPPFLGPAEVPSG